MKRRQMLQGYYQVKFPAETDKWDAFPQIGICEVRNGKFHDGVPTHMPDGFFYFEMVAGRGRARNDGFFGPQPTAEASAQAAWEFIKHVMARMELTRIGVLERAGTKDGRPTYRLSQRGSSAGETVMTDVRRHPHKTEERNCHER